MKRINPANHEQILQAAIEAESMLLGNPNRTTFQRNPYVIERDDLVFPLVGEIRDFLEEIDLVEVLEIGGGVGNTMRRLAHEFRNGANFTMTSLNPLPEHSGLRSLGV
ncbi:hypothetical protein HYW42_05415 [Candidatus Daviesbacteria bacterium]|nr:hypothetical protein [Candidatus Daviesbacteria bacterium]